MSISKPEARLELGLLNARANQMDPLDIVVVLTNRGLPKEVVNRLRQLYVQTKVIAGEVIQIGKIILQQIWEFIQEHPNLAVGVALGAAVGALTQLIPLIGPFIAPLAMTLGISLGAIAGHRLDEAEQGKPVDASLIGIAEDVIAIAREFFSLLSAIFFALEEYFS